MIRFLEIETIRSLAMICFDMEIENYIVAGIRKIISVMGEEQEISENIEKLPKSYNHLVIVMIRGYKTLKSIHDYRCSAGGRPPPHRGGRS
jgi:hypothetical protein